MPERQETSVAMPHAIHARACAHLLRKDGQEDLAFGIWYPSRGASRSTALLHSLIMPEEGDRQVHGNASFNAQYFARALAEAAAAGGGLAFMHSHLGPGWQQMSRDDRAAEANHAAAALAATGLPLVGLTLGTDGAWSARSWHRIAPKTYEHTWCDRVRVVGQGIRVTYHPRQVAEYEHLEELKRTISFWGKEAQEHLGRLRVGIIGVGSVGMLVHEALARMGVREIVVIDFDRLKTHNRDRTLNSTRADAKKRTFKVDIAARSAGESATAAGAVTKTVRASVVEPLGYAAALDCDVIFSCVDRPWPRRVLNHVAYAHLIPVIDGGIAIQLHPKAGKFRNATWSARTAAPGQRCLECAGAYDPGLVSVEREGYLDDPKYIQGLPDDSPLKRNENVFPMSMSLASAEVLQFVALATGLVGMRDVGEQRFTYYPGHLSSAPAMCDDSCPYPNFVARGEIADREVGAILGPHAAADKERAT